MKSLRHEENYFWSRFNEPNSDQLNLVEPNEFLPPISKWARIAGGVLITTFVAGVTLTSVLNYNVTVKVPANIRPLGELRVVQSAMTGTVQKVDVEANQLVTKGQIIARIDDSQLQTQKSQLESSIKQSQLQLSQIDAQISEINVQIAAQTNLINRTIIAAHAELNGAQRNYEDQQIKTTADMKQAETALRLAKEQLKRLQQEKLLMVNMQEAEAALTLARVQRERLQPILALGAVSRSLFEEKEQAVKSAEAKLEQAKASNKNLLEEKEEAVKSAQINLEKAKTAINPSNAAVTVASEQIKQEQAKGEANLAALKKERKALLQQHLELQQQLVSNGKELQQVVTDINKSVIRSPIEGTLLQLNLRNPGQVVQPSEAIASIAPLNAPILIKAQVKAQDIDKVNLGQKVQMQVSACPYPDYGTLKGIVSTVAADALPTVKNSSDASTSVAQVVAYEVTIQPQTLYVGKGDRQCYLKSGMEGKANIISRQETVLHFILRKARLITDF